MIHSKCNGNIVLDCTKMYSIQSPGIKITSAGVKPGVIQIELVNKRATPSLICSCCQSTFNTKAQFEEEILESCTMCGEKQHPQNIKLADGLGFVCVNCLEKINTNKPVSFDPDKYKILMYYGEVLKGKEFPTLLTILLKK